MVRKKNAQLQTDLCSVQLAFDEAQHKKKSSVIWTAVYTVLILACCILWKRSKMSVFGLVDCVALIGCIMAGIVILGIAVSLFSFLRDCQLRNMDYLVTYGALFLIDVLSYLGTVVAICLPCGIVWLLVEKVDPLHAWLVAPIKSILRYQGLRLAGCILAAVPYLLLGIRFSESKKKIPLYAQLLKDLREQKEAADLEDEKSYDLAKRKSWEKMKAQRKAAEAKKAARDHQSEHDSACESSDGDWDFIP